LQGHNSDAKLILHSLQMRETSMILMIKLNLSSRFACTSNFGLGMVQEINVLNISAQFKYVHFQNVAMKKSGIEYLNIKARNHLALSKLFYSNIIMSSTSRLGAYQKAIFLWFHFKLLD